MTNTCCTEQAKFPQSPRSLWWLRVGSLVHKRHVKGKDPEASLGRTGLCSHLQREGILFLLVFFPKDQNPQTNKAQMCTVRRQIPWQLSITVGYWYKWALWYFCSCRWWFYVFCCVALLCFFSSSSVCAGLRVFSLWKSYLTGAPRLWAGLRRTVTVLSVWFREVSWS